MKLSIAKFYQAHSSNYTKGRLYPISQITIHHTAGYENTLRYLYQNPARNGSAHFFVHPDYIEQYVDTNDTAWTNSNWPSNNRSITIEVRGDWRGYYDKKTLDQLEKLLYELRKNYKTAKLTYHKDEADKDRPTVCPADLKNKGYAQEVWNRVTLRLNPPPPKPSVIKYTKITPKKVELVRPANLWNFNFTDWNKAKAVKAYPKGHVVDAVVAVATNSLGGSYYMTAYSYDEGRIRATNGFNVADTKDYVPPKPAPKPDPEPEQPTPEKPPVNTDPETPTDSDVEQRLTAIETLLKKIVEFFKSLKINF